MSELALQLIREAKATRATRLDLGNCGLEELPEELFELVWLEELVLKNDRIQNKGELNQIKTLSPKIQLLGNLKKIDLAGGFNDSRSPLKDLSVLKDLGQLVQLNIANTQISDLSSLAKLKKLKGINISNTQVRDLNPLASLEKLEELYISHTQVDDLVHLRELINLNSLDVSFTQVSDLKHLQNLINLSSLDVSFTQVSDLKHLQNLINLKEFKAYGTLISDLNPLEKLINLKELFFSDSPISDLSPLANLINLNSLDASLTQISDLSHLSRLINLKELFIFYASKITDLSPLSNLTNLEKLFVFDTQVSDLSPLKGLGNLKVLDVKDNPIPYIPKEICNQHNCAQSLQAYWQELDHSQKTTNNQLKIMFLGNGCTGKTTLLHWFIDNAFKDIGLEWRTHGVFIQPWLLDDGKILANFWDFGGQEVYHATHRLFLGRRTLYLLVWASETPEGEEEMRHPPQYWLDMIADIADQRERSRVIIVQNQFEGQAVQNVLSNEALAEYAARGLDITLLNLDAKAGKGVKTFKAQVEEAAGHLLETYVEELPETWVNIRKAVAERREAKEKTLSWPDFVNICQECGLTTDPSITLGYLHRAGEVFYYPNQFDNQIILDQQWALKAVYAILKRDKIERYQGIFHVEDLIEIWQSENPDLTPEEAQIFLNFMLGNKTVFFTEGDSRNRGENPEFVVPQLLSEQKPKMWRVWENMPDKISHRIQYAFLHQDIIERFIVQTAHLSKDKDYWRNGLFIDHQNAQAVVEVISEGKDKYIGISCAGAGKEQLLQTIREEFHKIRTLDKATETYLVQGAWQPFLEKSPMRTDAAGGFPETAKPAFNPEDIVLKIYHLLAKDTNNMVTVLLKAHLEKLVFEANQKDALTILYDWAKEHDRSLNQEVIMLNARFAGLQRETNMGLLDQKDAKVALAQITSSLNYLIEKLPDNAMIEVEEGSSAKKEAKPEPVSGQLKILMLTANPAGTTKLNLDKEYARIAEKIQHKKDAFDLTVQRAVDKTAFRETTELVRPHVLHFAGHGEEGGEYGGIIVQNEDRNEQAMITPDGLDALFDYFKGEGIDLKAVVLNACYSQEQAEAIAKHVPYVIGTTVEIGDELATAFSVGFYFKLVESDCNIEQAFKSGRVAAQMEGAKKSHFVLFKNGERLDL